MIMNKRILLAGFSFLLFLAILLTLSTGNDTAQGKTITVDDDGGADYEVIQDAIYGAQAGDEIRVYDGVYYDTLWVDRSLSFVGNGSETTVIDGTGGDRSHVVQINANWVNVTGFTITGSENADGINSYNYDHITLTNNNISGNGQYGVFMELGNQYTIEDNNISHNNRRQGGAGWGGMKLSRSWYGEVHNNTFLNNYHEALRLSSSHNFNVTNNIITGTTGLYGIYLDPVSDSLFQNNTITDNNASGIWAMNSWDNHYLGNTISRNQEAIYGDTYGFFIQHSRGNLIMGNAISNSQAGDGLHLISSSELQVSQNTITHNLNQGIYMRNLDNATFSLNNLSWNGRSGICLNKSRDNLVIDNTILDNNYGDKVYYNGGINLDEAKNNTFEHNLIERSQVYGVRIYYSHNNTFSFNRVLRTITGQGAFLWESNANVFESNEFSENDGSGLQLEYARDNRILNNTLDKNTKRSNSDAVIWVVSSPGTLVFNNSVTNTVTGHGIQAFESQGASFLQNTITGSGGHGFRILQMDGVEFAYNTIMNNNDTGIFVDYRSENNILHHNTIIDNENDAFDEGENNHWDNGSAGNFWDNYSGEDSDKDGIGETGFAIEGGTGLDRYPLMRPFDVVVPVAVAGPDQETSQDGEVMLDGSASSDNLWIVSWNWSFVHDDSDQELTGEAVDFEFLIVGNYEVTLTVTDAGGNTDTDTLWVRVSDTTPPVADAGADQMVAQGVSVLFDGSGSSDNGDVVNWTWSFSEYGENITLYGTMGNHVFTEMGGHEITLRIRDAVGLESTDVFQVNITDGTLPVAEAGSDVAVMEGETVTLDGRASTDNVGIVNWSWSFQDGGNMILYGSTVTHSFRTPGEYSIQMEVRDAAGYKDTDTVTITVEAASVAETGRITGSIGDNKGRNPVGVIIILLMVEENGTASYQGIQVTDASGAFSFENLTPGDYYLVPQDFVPPNNESRKLDPHWFGSFQVKAGETTVQELWIGYVDEDEDEGFLAGFGMELLIPALLFLALVWRRRRDGPGV